ncbi:MAG: hypothetical protein HUK40_23245 [Desulfobacter sp.]|nr:hypothetical protein [Desulfobacter sp.]
MTVIRINGIRVGHQMFHLRQGPESENDNSLIYQTLAREKINLPCMGTETAVFGTSVSCCIEGEVPRDLAIQPVCMISVYPHRSKIRTLGYLLDLFAGHDLKFFHMVSSNAMVSFVIDQADKLAVLAMLEQAFDLPPTHTPYEPNFHEQTAAFVKKRYQETRAFFQEEKIKTYGFSLIPGLCLKRIFCPWNQLEQAIRFLQNTDDIFSFATAFAHGKRIHLYWLAQESSLTPKACPVEFFQEQVDLITFQGPHFGDRFGIFNTAAACLESAGLELEISGCTGASISLVLSKGEGSRALPALEKGFETP